MREKSSVVRFSHHDECIIRFLKRHAHVHSLLLLFRYFSTIAAAAIFKICFCSSCSLSFAPSWRSSRTDCCEIVVAVFVYFCSYGAFCCTPVSYTHLTLPTILLV